jgi:hypothetical protein
MKTMTRLLAVFLVIAAAGCARWQAPRALPPPAEAPVTLPAARVTPRTTGMMVVLRDVRITADSVIGWGEGEPDRSGLLRGSRTRVAVHRSQVLVYEPANQNPFTGGAALSLLLLGGVVVLYLIGEGSV